jgi:hypothetical protein
VHAVIHNDRHGGADERAGAVIGVFGLMHCALIALQRRPLRPDPRCSGWPRREGQQQGAAGTCWEKTGCMLGHKKMFAVSAHACAPSRPILQAPGQPACCCGSGWLFALACVDLGPVHSSLHDKLHPLGLRLEALGCKDPKGFRL